VGLGLTAHSLSLLEGKQRRYHHAARVTFVILFTIKILFQVTTWKIEHVGVDPGKDLVDRDHDDDGERKAKVAEDAADLYIGGRTGLMLHRVTIFGSF
jgi:hypothetical protein